MQEDTATEPVIESSSIEEIVQVQAKRKTIKRANVHISFDANKVVDSRNNSQCQGDYLISHHHVDPTCASQYEDLDDPSSKATFDETEDVDEYATAWEALASLLSQLMRLPSAMRDVVCLMVLNPVATSSEISRLMHTRTSTQQRREAHIKKNYPVIWDSISAYRRKKGLNL
jgi:DNA-directed RNA polymerase specialized sigma24 family protein